MSKKISKKSKNSRGHRRRKRALGIAALVLLLMIGLLIPLTLQNALVVEIDPPERAQMLSVNFYFRDESGHWGSEPRQVEIADNTDIIEAVLQGLQEGPQASAFSPSIPQGVYILGARLEVGTEANTLFIEFSPSFNDISQPIEMIFATSSLVYTLTDLDFVDQLVFYVNNQPMLDGDGNPFGLRSRENTSLETVVGLDVATTNIVLYFTNAQMTGLVAEPRTIDINPLEDIERFILDALLEGPQTYGLFEAIPIGTTYNRVERMGDTVFVGFTQDFYDSLSGGGFALEEMMVFSLVNTLTERPEVRRVQIFIDGEPIQSGEGSSLHMDLSRPIERDEGLIIEH
ncbi:MAG: GerMN domain-containing protein [Defluviitaleaceae bacterium]|nr:GerMN domain-containing protein [Defluviitaleaceae bacterium]